MQTFLPYPEFYASAKTLDRQRLGKQRVECWQIVNVLVGDRFGVATKIGWRNHPAVLMWQGYENALAEYAVVICNEWVARGYRDSLGPRFAPLIVNQPKWPWWLGDERLHRSHRANLVSKMPQYYAPQFGPLEWEAYWWPVRVTQREVRSKIFV